MPTAHSDKIDQLSNQEPLITQVRSGVSSPPPLMKVSSGPTVEGRYTPTPSLNPKTIELLEGVNDQTIGYVRTAIDAFGEAHSALQRLSDAREQIKKDTSKTPANQILLIAASAEKLQERITRKMDLAHKTMSDGIAHIEKELSAPLTAKADTTLGREVREHVKNLSSEKRHAFLENALTENDLSTLHAVLGAQPFLSSITNEMKAHFTRALHEKNQPDVALRLKVMKKTLELVQQRGPLVHIEIQKVMGADWEMVGKLRKAQTAAEQALLLVNAPTQQ